ncbi:DUF2684 family protein [Edwardsiella piscicida]|nr:DUF2684 family protein [Edwardsiella piscicida]
MVPDASCNAPQAKPLSSLSVKKYRWINIWTAILGQGGGIFPLLFCRKRTLGDPAAHPVIRLQPVDTISFCFFSPLSV